MTERTILANSVLCPIMTTTREVVVVKDIRSHRLVHRIPSYFDSPDPTYLIPPPGTSQASTPPTIAVLVHRDSKAVTRALCKGSLPCSHCAFLISRGHDNTLCYVVGRPHTPQSRDTFPHRMFTDDELIRVYAKNVGSFKLEVSLKLPILEKTTCTVSCKKNWSNRKTGFYCNWV